MRTVTIRVQAKRYAIFRDLSLTVALFPEREAQADVCQVIIGVQADGLSCCGLGVVPLFLLVQDKGQAEVDVGVLRVKQ